MYEKILSQYFIAGNHNYLSGQPEELEPAAPAEEERNILTVIETSLDRNSGETINVLL